MVHVRPSPSLLSPLKPISISTSIPRPQLQRLRTFTSLSLSSSSSIRVHPPIRRVSELDTLILLSSSSRTPLITFWSASWCSSCKVVKPLVEDALLSLDSSGDLSCGSERKFGLGVVEVEIDSPDLASEGVGMRYMISSIPTLLSFSRGEPQIQARLTDVNQMKDKERLRTWLVEEARRGGDGGAGGTLLGGNGLVSGLKSLFGGK